MIHASRFYEPTTSSTIHSDSMQDPFSQQHPHQTIQLMLIHHHQHEKKTLQVFPTMNHTNDGQNET